MTITSIMLLTFSAIFVLLVVLAVHWFLDVRGYLAYIRRYPNQAYDFFVANSDRWAVFEVASTEITLAQLPSPSGLPQGKLLGPFQFRVPKRQNRFVTVYGKSKDCLECLDQFVFRMKTLPEDIGGPSKGW